MVQAQTAQEALNSLNRGDWKTFKRYAERAPGVEGQLARARLAIILGRPDQALAELEGKELEIEVTRLEALCRDRQFTRARDLLRTLEARRQGLKSPYDFHFYLCRGELERHSRNADLARKNFQHALRLARTADQKCQALDRLTDLWRDFEELEKAKKALAESSQLVDELESVWVSAFHLKTAADLEYFDGGRASARSMYRACQDIYRAHGNHIKLADSIQGQTVFTDLSGEIEKSYEFARTSLEIYLREGHYRAAVASLRNLRELYFQLAKKRKLVEFEQLFENTIAQIPSGRFRDEAKTVYARFLFNVDGDREKALELTSSGRESSDPLVRTRAHLRAGHLLRALGRYPEARTELDRALSQSPGQLMRRDRDWGVSTGPIYLHVAELESQRHNSKAALSAVRRGIEEQSGDDWRYWRIQARYKSLLIAVDSHDEKSSIEEMGAALEEIEKLPQPVGRAGSFTNILASLLLNQSVGDDVIEPSKYVLGDYGLTAKRVIKETFRDPQLVSRFLSYYDEWQRDAEVREETSMQPHPPIYKGLFLEALGRLDEARISLQLGLDAAEKNEVKAGQMVSRILLARIALRNGEAELAADYMTRAAEVAEALNPLAGRFYLLTAGAIQRDVGRFDEALTSFTKAIELNPTSQGPSYFGRALTFEKMGRLERARLDVEKAMSDMEARGLSFSVARLKGVKARLLTAQGRYEEAIGLYREAHQEFLSRGASESLDQVSVDYALCLEQMGQKEQALQVLTNTLDQLLGWHALNPIEHESLIEKTVQLALNVEQKALALKYLQLSHSAEFLRSVDFQNFETDDPESQQLIRKLGRLKSQMESLGRQGSEEKVGRLLADTRQEFFSTLNALRASESDFEALVQLSGSQLSSIQQLLSPESIILEYFPAKNKLYIFAVTARSFTLHEVVISRADLDNLVRQHLDFSKDPSRRKTGEASQRLHTLLIGSLNDRLQGMKNLRVVPSGPLWNVSFSSLVQPDGQPLVQDFEISYLTSSDLARIRRTDERPPAAPRRALLVGGASDLQGAQSEIRSISEKLTDSKMIPPKEANLNSFLKAIQGRDLIHIASHSRVSNKAGESYVELGDERLSLERVYGLHLEPSSLVVLSSCLSGVGVQPPGKEVTSLASAFSVAGASTVVASRWSVDDKSTARFFHFFYEALLRGRRRGQAFREAEMKMSQLYPHPYYWAGFSLFGDPD